MKSNTKQVRDAVKNLIIEKGANNILNRHITEVVERIGCTCCDVQNAMSYFRYSPQQAKFREYDGTRFDIYDASPMFTDNGWVLVKCRAVA